MSTISASSILAAILILFLFDKSLGTPVKCSPHQEAIVQFCHPSDRGSYYVCSAGHSVPQELKCPPGLTCEEDAKKGSTTCVPDITSKNATDPIPNSYSKVVKKTRPAAHPPQPAAQTVSYTISKGKQDNEKAGLIDAKDDDTVSLEKWMELYKYPEEILKLLQSLATSTFVSIAKGTKDAADESRQPPIISTPPKKTEVHIVPVSYNSHNKLSKCEEDKCKLPNCFCPSTKLPGSLTVDRAPQLVYFSFDDAVSVINYEFYERLFPKDRTNPNGCPIKATYFISNDYTDYDLVQKLYERGHEIASHSITHRTPTSWWKDVSYQDLADEMDGQRRYLHKKAKVPQGKITGVRLPYLQLNGNTHFKMLRDYNFKYDSSMAPTRPHNLQDKTPPMFPFTMDYPPTGYSSACSAGPKCPTSSFPGIWEIPLNRLFSNSNFPCTMIDACASPNTEEESYQYLMSNFERHYNSNKAPFGLNMHAAWFFNRPHNLQAMDRFIQELLKKDDVWIVTISEMIDWMKNPKSKSNMGQFTC